MLMSARKAILFPPSERRPASSLPSLLRRAVSLLLLIDGYNIATPIAPSRSPDPRWLEQIRNALLRDLSTFLDATLRKQTCVVFDAANPPRDRSDRFTHQGIDVRFAVGYLRADDLLEALIAAHHSPKRLMVVSSDHRIQAFAKRRGASFMDSEPWMDELTDGRVRLAIKHRPDAAKDSSAGADTNGAGEGRGSKPQIQSDGEVEQWMRDFGFDDE